MSGSFLQSGPKTFKKHIPKTLTKLDLEPKNQGHSKSRSTIIFKTTNIALYKNSFAGVPLVNAVTPTDIYGPEPLGQSLLDRAVKGLLEAHSFQTAFKTVKYKSNMTKIKSEQNK